MLKTIAGLQGVTVLSKEAQKKIGGGVASCGNVATSADGSRCVILGRSKAEAKEQSAMFNLGYSSGEYSGYEDLNWCCASCGNFEECLGDI